MSGMIYKTVDCLRNGELIASYPLSYAITIVPSVPPDLIEEAKASLIHEGVIKPPFDFSGMAFRIRDGW